MQKVFNFMAFASFVVVFGGGTYLYLSKSKIVDSVKTQIVSEISKGLPKMIEGMIPELPEIEIPEFPKQTGGIIPENLPQIPQVTGPAVPF